jgi:hypothetical protein
MSHCFLSTWDQCYDFLFIGEKKLAILTQTTHGKLGRKMDHYIGFKKNSIFSTKIAIIKDYHNMEPGP